MTLKGINTTFDAFWEQLLPSKTRKVQPSTGALGYGADINMTVSAEGVIDIDPMWRMTDPQSFSGIFQACVRRLTTPQGRLRRHNRYGLDVLGLLNRGISSTLLQTLPMQVEREIRKDERIQAAKCTALQTGLDTLTLEIQIQPRDSRESFAFTLTADGSGKLLAQLAK